jgi:small ligand-binding sensory domain FIST
MNQASLALNGHLLDAGSFLGVSFTGNVGLLAVVAQGCRPVGPTFVITQASGTVLTGLSGETAISQLENVANEAEEADQELIRNGELVCGIGSSSSSASSQDDKLSQEKDGVPTEDDFLIRQIMGFQPKSGSVVVASGGLQEGNTFRFHVRAAQSAREDMYLMIQRAKTERLFAGSSTVLQTKGSVSVSAGKPIAAMQISCIARGLRFFGAPNVDLNQVETLFQDASVSGNESDGASEADKSSTPAIAGFFANGEIGPVGIRMADMISSKSDADSVSNSNMNINKSRTFLHGFTTVVAMLCDYSETESSASGDELSTDTIISTMDDAWA